PSRTTAHGIAEPSRVPAVLDAEQGDELLRQLDPKLLLRSSDHLVRQRRMVVVVRSPEPVRRDRHPCALCCLTTVNPAPRPPTSPPSPRTTPRRRPAASAARP